MWDPLSEIIAPPAIVARGRIADPANEERGFDVALYDPSNPGMFAAQVAAAQSLRETYGAEAHNRAWIALGEQNVYVGDGILSRVAKLIALQAKHPDGWNDKNLIERYIRAFYIIPSAAQQLDEIEAGKETPPSGGSSQNSGEAPANQAGCITWCSNPSSSISGISATD